MENKNRLTLIEGTKVRKGKTSYYADFICECGNIKNLQICNVGKSTFSCGCLKKETVGNSSRTHGGSSSSNRIYRMWKNMKSRCLSKSNQRYILYGARGISIDPSWYDFAVFQKWCLENNYDEKLSIDRIDVNGNYEPSNCRFATQTEQMQNTRVSVGWEMAGKIRDLYKNGKNIKEICKILGTSKSSTESILTNKRYKIEDKGLGNIKQPVPKKLNLEKAREIRKLYSEGKTAKQIAPLYSVHEVSIRSILRNEVYKEKDQI